MSSCAKKTEQYSFYVAGHLYGKPGNNELGAYSKFKDKFENIRSYEDLSFGVLTGDAVKGSTDEEWLALIEDLDMLPAEYHLARGNHDYKNKENLNKYFPESYYSFKKGADLHIILDANLDGWNITGEQLTFLKNTINENKDEAKNFFIYTHQVIWFNPDDHPRYLHVNSEEGRNPVSNFKTEVLPLFKNLENQVYFFAGDVGAGSWASDINYTKPNNHIHLIANGMGDGVNDSFIMVSVSEYAEPKFSVISVDPSAENQIQNLESFLK